MRTNTRASKTPTNMNGFTLWELLFTITLFSILLLFSLSSVTDLKQKNEADFLINEIETAVNSAKIQARANGFPLTLRTNDWSEGMELVKNDSASQNVQVIRQWAWKVRYWHIEWQGIKGPKEISFSGTVQAMSNGQFILTNKGNGKKIILFLNKLGRVKQG